MALEVGKLFFNYLKSKSLLTTCHISQLRADYDKWIRGNRNIQAPSPNFEDVVQALEFCDDPLLRVKPDGFVLFRTHQTWKKDQTAKTERARLFNLLRMNKNKEKLYSGNGSIELSCSSQNSEYKNGFFSLKMQGVVETFDVVIRNICKYSVVLRKCLPLRDLKEFSFADEFECTNERGSAMCEIPPGRSYNIHVKCTIPEKIGLCVTDLFFNFQVLNTKKEGFHMLRCISCMKSDETIEGMRSPEEFVKRPKIEQYYTNSYMHGDRVTITGNNLQRELALKKYPVPRELKIALKKGAFRNFADDNSLTSNEKAWRKLLEDNLDSANYSKRFSLLLHLEELQGQADIRLYDLKNVTIERSRSGDRFWLKVPGLAEKRPSVIRGDRIDLYRLDANGKALQDTAYAGYVHEVSSDKVLLAMNFGFTHKKEMKFNAVFTFHRYPIKLEHRAIGTLLTSTNSSALFPQYSSVNSSNVQTGNDLRFFNRKIDTNPEQQRAVRAIALGTSKLPYIIYGPPGTGKTVTMVESIQQVVSRQKDVHILVCAPSNSACDLLVERLITHLNKAKVFRICASSRDFAFIPKSIKEVSNYNQADHDFYFPSKQELEQYNVLATTLITAGRLATAKFPSDHFDFVFVDEAGYAMEPEFMTAVAGVLSSTGRIVMAGDPKQLGPVLFSNLATAFGLGTSYLERLMRCDVYLPNDDQHYNNDVVTKLLKNYRSHKAILEIPNQSFYENELEVCADEIERNLLCRFSELPKRNFPVIFHNIKGKDCRSPDSPSFYNLEEASMVHHYVQELLSAKGNGITAAHIGIISPYRKQTHKIREVLSKKMKATSGSKKIKIGSVEEFQGQERRVIIISTVRSSNEHLKEDNRFRLGFLKNEKRFNVAITRAKCLLIVVGDADVLCTDHYWKKFIVFCRENGGFTGPDVNAKSLSAEDVTDDASPDGSAVDEIVERLKLLELDKLEEQTGSRPEE